MDAANDRFTLALLELDTHNSGFEDEYGEQIRGRSDIAREVRLFARAITEHTREVIADEAMLQAIMARAGSSKSTQPMTASYEAPMPMFGRRIAKKQQTFPENVGDAFLDASAEEDLLAWQMKELANDDDAHMVQRHR